MCRQPSSRSQRPGAVVVLLAVLLIPLTALVAMAVDLAWIMVTEADLQNAADAAALAGASQLESGFVQYYLSGQTQQATILAAAEANAKTYAKNFASFNGAGGVTSLALNDSDVEFGYTDASGTYTACPTYTGFPNTIKVTIRRDSTANTPLPLFFGPVLGTSTASLKATAAATIYTGVVDSFQAGFPGHVFILPMTYDVNHWNGFLQTGQGPDGTTDTALNGTPQLLVYPSLKYYGNFGLLSLDQANDGASTISTWISSGVSASDLQNEISANLLPLSSSRPSLWDWKGDPGLKDSDASALRAQVGQTYLVPLFKPEDAGIPNPSTYTAGSGNGSHYYYDIVQLVSATVTTVDSQGVHLQPTAMQVPYALFTSVTPAAAPTSATPLATTFAPPKLTQ